MTAEFLDHLKAELRSLEDERLVKQERLIAGSQGGVIEVHQDGATRSMVNLCANNYLGLSDHPDIKVAAREAIDMFGFGLASVRFICGTQTMHRALEQAIADYLRMDDAILFAACFDANGGVFETLLSADDAVISDSLNHASIIDGIRLSKARRYRYATGDMDALQDALKQADADGARFRLIVTDGVFSMDGYVAKLPEICTLAETFGALVMVDDCHATGHLGHKGRGTPALTGAEGRIAVITGTFGKTLGGAMGGFIAAAQPIIDTLRQRARPYLFSNSLPPSVAAGSLKAITIAQGGDDLRARLQSHAARFRAGLATSGFDLLPGNTPIVPVMTHDARLAQDMAAELDKRGVFVAGFFFPVVPRGKARIRAQLSAALDDKDVDFAIDAFKDAGEAVGLI